jgi:hypothetical protein
MRDPKMTQSVIDVVISRTLLRIAIPQSIWLLYNKGP